MNEYLAVLVSIAAVQLISAHALAITLCVARVFNLAHVALLGLGAYCAAIFAVRAGTPFIVCLLLAATLPAIVAALISFVALRGRRDRVALLTLGLNIILLAVFTNARSLTAGASGLVGIPIAYIGKFSLETPISFGIFSAVVCLICLVLVWQLRNSQLGRAMLAQAELPTAAEALGLDPNRLKRLALVSSGALVGIAGGLSAFRLGLVAPNSFGFSELSLVLMIVILGRAGSFWGVTLAAILFSVLPELLRLAPFWQSLGAHSGAWFQLISAAFVYFILRTGAATNFEEARANV